MDADHLSSLRQAATALISTAAAPVVLAALQVLLADPEFAAVAPALPLRPPQSAPESALPQAREMPAPRPARDKPAAGARSAATPSDPEWDELRRAVRQTMAARSLNFGRPRAGDRTQRDRGPDRPHLSQAAAPARAGQTQSVAGKRSGSRVGGRGLRGDVSQHRRLDRRHAGQPAPPVVRVHGLRAALCVAPHRSAAYVATSLAIGLPMRTFPHCRGHRSFSSGLPRSELSASPFTER
jgi:hypothetical protein